MIRQRKEEKNGLRLNMGGGGEWGTVSYKRTFAFSPMGPKIFKEKKRTEHLSQKKKERWYVTEGRNIFAVAVGAQAPKRRVAR